MEEERGRTRRMFSRSTVFCSDTRALVMAAGLNESYGYARVSFPRASVPTRVSSSRGLQLQHNLRDNEINPLRN